MVDEETFNLVKILSEKKFNELVKEYNRCKYDTWDVNIVNGPYDGGVDLVVRISDKEIKKNIQITIQDTGLEGKLKEDLEKARKNILYYNYLNEMQLFVPYRITKSRQNKLERLAEVAYGITLQIIDGNKISEDCSIFHQLKPFIYKLHELQSITSIEVNKNDKIVFDYLALSKDSAEVKKIFIQFYILSFLQDHSPCTEDEILEGVKLNTSSRTCRFHTSLTG